MRSKREDGRKYGRDVSVEKRQTYFRDVLSWPLAYGFFSYIVTSGKTYPIVTKEYIKPKTGDRVLDIGCGIGRILNYLPCVEYTGFDINYQYVEAAKRRYGARGTFMCNEVNKELIKKFNNCDIVLALGVLHHLDDFKAEQLFEIARNALGAGGRLITFDGCYLRGQRKFVRYLLSRDRGKYVRTRDEYIAIASKVFSKVAANTRSDLLFFPYDHIIMECSV